MPAVLKCRRWFEKNFFKLIEVIGLTEYIEWIKIPEGYEIEFE